MELKREETFSQNQMKNFELINKNLESFLRENENS